MKPLSGCFSIVSTLAAFLSYAVASELSTDPRLGMIDVPFQEYDLTLLDYGTSIASKNSGQVAIPQAYNLSSFVEVIKNTTKVASTVNWKDEDSPFQVGNYEWPSLREFKAKRARCSTPDPTYEQKQESDQMLQGYLASQSSKPGGVRRKLPDFPMATTPITIPVYWWCLTDGRLGRCSTAVANDQISVLNSAYAMAGISFELVSALYSDDPEHYYCSNTNDQIDYKIRLRRGGAETLNVYTCTTTDGTLGWAAFPHNGSSVDFYDGVVLNEDTMPGGSNYPYNLGDTLVHEVGHWLGLYHTFENGCDSVGDRVSDTAPEALPAYECEIGRDTCVGGGVDPVTNYMDYTEDSCLAEFTLKQKDRMRAAWSLFRSPNRTRPRSSDSSRTFRIVVRHDSYPEEVGWSLKRGSTTIISQRAGSITRPGQVVNRTATLTAGQYTFTITDSEDDGLCCEYGGGTFLATVGNNQILSGSRYTGYLWRSFTIR
jgi:hypothetical protein